jgi:hypothetical protein
MARSYGTILCAIWADPEFCALSSDAQRTYLMLVTQPDITACGSLPLTFRRWSMTLPQGERDRLAPALVELETARFVLVDRDTEELLVRSFAKHDGGYKHAKRVLAVIGYAEAIRSQSLRSVVVVELAKLGVSIPARVALNTEPIPNDDVIESGRVVVTEVPQLPQPTTHNREPAPIRSRCNQKHPADQPCGLCRQDRLDDEAAAALTDVQKRAALARNEPAMAELNADLAKPLDKSAFVAAREIFQAKIESRTA